MNPRNAGLNLPAKVPQLPIGSPLYFPQAGTILTLADRSEWLQSGQLIVPKVKHKKATKLSFLRCIGAVTGDLPVAKLLSAAPYAYSSALGRGVLCQDVTSGGNTVMPFSGTTLLPAATVPIAAPVSSVVWDAAVGRFIAVGNTAATLYIAYSTDGQVWTAGTTAAGTYTANSAKIATAPEGGLTGIAVTGTAGVIFAYTGDGSTITPVPGAPTTSGGTIQDLAYNNSDWVAICTGANWFQFNTIGVTSFAKPANASTSASATIHFFGLSSAVVPCSVAGQYLLTDSFGGATTTWQQKSFPGLIAANQPIVTNTRFSKTSDGWIYVGMTNSLLRTKDGYTWERISVLQTAAGSNASWRLIETLGGSAILLNNSSVASTRYVVVASREGAEMLGLPYGVTADASGDGATLYHRIA